MIGVQMQQAYRGLSSSDDDDVEDDFDDAGDAAGFGVPASPRMPDPNPREALALDTRPGLRGFVPAGGRSRILDLARRPDPVSRFNAIRLGDTTLWSGNPEVLKAIVALAVSIGGAAAFGFGLGRGMGGALAELGVRHLFGTEQPLGIGEDRNYFDQDTDHNLAQIAAIATGRWLGATICGGLCATLASVVAPRIAALTGRQLAPIPPEELVPDRVAELRDATGTPYGRDGVDRLRQEIRCAQVATGHIEGTTHVRSGAAAFGVLNAVRGTALGMSPIGVLPDIGISAAVSLTAGASTGLAAGTLMVHQRHRVPDAAHVGDGPAPLVRVPLFEVRKTAPVPPRFTGTGVRHGLANVTWGAADRIRLFIASTWLLGLLGLLVNLAGAGTRREPLNWVHRAGKAIELGVGVGVAVGPYFRGLPPINARDHARLASQRGAHLEEARQGRREPRADAPLPVETLALRRLG
ncbi:hypothetical protein [Mitsuaria sp. 7]|uniref:hypothetical protein n=1 Tax=Mitsuaria sp. 7 TaxID=1658665 RepID=UPI000AE8BC92|nr:hypothetical protein [Mitsuaria sp. 7]